MASSRILNLAKPQEQLLLWHNIFGHFDICQTKILTTTVGDDIEPIIIPKLLNTRLWSIPLYRGNGNRTIVKVLKVKRDVKHPESIRANYLQPRNRISTNQLEYWIKERLPHTRWKKGPSKIYIEGNVFVDHTYNL